MATADQIQTGVTKLISNMDRLDRITNGGDTETVQTDDEVVPSVSNLFRQIRDNSGYLVPVAFTSGLTVSTSAFTVEHSGEVYAARPSEVPFTTTSTFDANQWFLVDASNGVFDPGLTDSVNRSVQSKLTDFVSIKDFGAVGDGATSDLAAATSAIASGSSFIFIPPGDFDLGGGTLSIPPGVSVIFSGGKLSNGTVDCDNCLFFGARGLEETITLTGTVTNESGVFFEWFTCEKADAADYTTFVNGNNATYGAVPSIAATNRTILKMLIDNGHEVCFGAGIYPFDAELSITGRFRIRGVSRSETLLWAPASNLLHYSSGGATYPAFRDITIEANGSIVLTDAWTTNAIHGFVMERSFFISYADHCFQNDYSTAGGTGCPIYGCKITECAVFAAAGKGGFFGWQSGSNTFDNIVDHHMFFNGVGTRYKGTMKAIFYNSNVRKLTNSNIAYSAFDYAFYWDRASSLVRFNAFDNVFETNTNSFKAIARIDSGGSNFYLASRGNQYIGSPTESYHYICNAGNTYVYEMDAPTPVYGSATRNLSATQEVKIVTGLIDSGGTKYRLGLKEPRGIFSGNSQAVLLTANATNAALIGMSAQYAADSANISYIEVTPSNIVRKNRALSGGFGTTAARPTYLIYAGYPYFDTTLGKPIWYDGSGWVDSSGTSV